MTPRLSKAWPAMESAQNCVQFHIVVGRFDDVIAPNVIFYPSVSKSSVSEFSRTQTKKTDFAILTVLILIREWDLQWLDRNLKRHSRFEDFYRLIPLTSYFRLSWYHVDCQTSLYVPDNVGYISRRMTWPVRSRGELHWISPTVCRWKLVGGVGVHLEESSGEAVELFPFLRTVQDSEFTGLGTARCRSGHEPSANEWRVVDTTPRYDHRRNVKGNFTTSPKYASKSEMPGPCWGAVGAWSCGLLDMTSS